MRHCVAVLLAGLLVPALGRGQWSPKPTPEGRTALKELLQACATAGGLQITKNPKGGPDHLTLMDANKLRGAVRAHRELLTPAARDALLAFADKAEQTSMPAVILLLRTLGSEMKDERAMAYATLLEGLAAHRQGKFGTAVEKCREAGRRFKAIPDPLWEAFCLWTIGSFQDEHGAYAKALDYFDRALAIERNLHRDEHSDFANGLVANTLNSIGRVYDKQGAYAKALDNYQQALAIQRKLLGEEHPDVAQSLNNIGVFYEKQGAYAQAQRYCQQALAIWRKAYGEQDPHVATALNNIGLVHFDQGAYAEALDYWQRALAIQRKVLGDHHPDVAFSLNNIGEAYKREGAYAKALSYDRRALAIWRKAYGDQHPDVAIALNNIGMVYYDEGAYAAALTSLKGALARISHHPPGAWAPELA